jgi:hypothetical protein
MNVPFAGIRAYHSADLTGTPLFLPFGRLCFE